jgi:demethylmenaquinone methyltransferase / 2-methoxy-6-polyprenyl-1,4-benzoquinol methylase
MVQRDRSSAMTQTVDYGFEQVDPEEKTRRVRRVFESVARRYDLMNDLMSGGLHRLWKDWFVRRVNPRSGEAVLDLAGGTGDIAFRMAKRGALVTVSDINPEMLAVGQKRAKQRRIEGLSWREANAETLPFGDAQFDAVTIAFGIRNVTDRLAALKEARRVLKPGGRFFCLEFSHVELPVLDKIYESYSMKLVPQVGKVVARDEEAYRYLVESIRQFPDAPTFAALLRQAGLSQVRFDTLSGGIVAIHSGWRT